MVYMVYDIMIYDMVRYMIWYGIWYDIYDMVYDIMIYDMVWYDIYDVIWYDMIYLTVIVLTPGGSNTVHIYTQKIHRTTQWNRIPRTERT